MHRRPERVHVYFHLALGSERKELLVICGRLLSSKWGWVARGGKIFREREKATPFFAALWERQHVLEGLWATGLIPPQACLPQYGGDWLLNGSTWPSAFPLSGSDFTGLPSQHPPAVLYAVAPVVDSPPPTHSLPPVQSLQLDPLWMTPSRSA